MSTLMYDHGAKKRGIAADSYYTPLWFTIRLPELIGDYFDPCPGFSDARTTYPVQSGLEINWKGTGKKVFMNPPFSELERWIDKANLEADQGVFTLYFGKLDYRTKWGIALAESATFVRPILGYVKYLGVDGHEFDGAPFQNCIAGFGTDSGGVENKVKKLFRVAN